MKYNAVKHRVGVDSIMQYHSRRSEVALFFGTQHRLYNVPFDGAPCNVSVGVVQEDKKPSRYYYMRNKESERGLSGARVPLV